MPIINSMKLNIEAKSQNESLSRSVVAGFYIQLNPTLEQVEDLKTAVSEAVTNCIVHAYEGSQQGTIDIACDLYEDRIEVVITDYGKGIDNVEQAMQPFYTTGKKGERSGMGFTVMQAFCDKVEVNSQQGLTTVTLVKKA
ncbi:MAG: anti-sigma F factor [Corallococcus sp.]|nr:anti-sigma F factor [Corallococcus sp.]